MKQPSKPNSAVTTLPDDQKPSGKLPLVLPEVFTENFFLHTLVFRHKMLAVYRRDSTKGNHRHYETVRIRVQKANTRFGKEYPAKEMYPHDEGWGMSGWTFQTGEEAMAKLSELDRLDMAKKAATKTAV